MHRFLAAFRRDRRGVTAVEFSLVAPVLALMAVASFDGGISILRYYDMKEALSSGAQYVMQGGTSSTVAQALIMSAWTRKSSDAKATVVQNCKCGTTVSICSALCGDGSVPKSYYQFNASMTSKGLFVSKSIAAQDIVRVR